MGAALALTPDTASAHAEAAETIAQIREGGAEGGRESGKTRRRKRDEIAAAIAAEWLAYHERGGPLPPTAWARQASRKHKRSWNAIYGDLIRLGALPE